MEMRICTEEGLKAIEVGENVKLCVLYFRLRNVRSTSDLLVIKCFSGELTVLKQTSQNPEDVLWFFISLKRKGA